MLDDQYYVEMDEYARVLIRGRICDQRLGGMALPFRLSNVCTVVEGELGMIVSDQTACKLILDVQVSSNFPLTCYSGSQRRSCQLP